MAASVGPTGQIVEDEGGSVTELDGDNWLKEEVVGLAAGGADALRIQTMSSVAEAVAAVKGGEDKYQAAGHRHVTFEPGVRGFRTTTVLTRKQHRRRWWRPERIVGANCGNDIAKIIEITKQIRAAVPHTPS